MSLFRSRTVNSDQKKLENLKDAISNRASGNFVMEAEGRDDRKGSGKGIKRDKSIFRAMMHKVN